MKAKLPILLLNNLVKKNSKYFNYIRRYPTKTEKVKFLFLFFYVFIIDYFGKSMAPFGGTFHALQENSFSFQPRRFVF